MTKKTDPMHPSPSELIRQSVLIPHRRDPISNVPVREDVKFQPAPAQTFLEEIKRKQSEGSVRLRSSLSA